MAISEYLAGLRAKVGSAPILSPSVSVMVIEKGQVLAGMHREMSGWVFPGGAVDPHETPADAAVREVWEETGLIVRPLRLLGVWAGRAADRVVYRNGDIVDYFMVGFEAEVTGGRLRRDDEELIHLEWVSVEELMHLDTAPWVEAQVEAWRNEGAVFEPATWAPPGTGGGVVPMGAS